MGEFQNMRLGCAAWGLRETPLEEQLKLTRRLNLDYLELSIGNGGGDRLQPESTLEEAHRVKDLFAAAGISPECGCTGNDFTGDDVEVQLERLRRVIAVASAAGVGLLRIFAGFNSDSAVFGARFDKMCEALAAASSCAAEHGVTLAVETHGGVAVNGDALVHFQSVTTRIDLWPAILAAGVAINYDPANFAAAGATDPVAFYREFKPYIRCIHLKDFKSVPGGVVPAACGEGRLAWPALLGALADYTGPALFEYELPGDVEDGMRRSLNFIKTFKTA